MSDSGGDGRPLSGMAIATVFRGDPKQLAQWCNYHLNQGADRLYVTLDRPSESMTATLPQSDRVDWVPIGENVWRDLYPAAGGSVELKQVDSLRSMAGRARADGHEFLAFVDADELIVLSEPFRHITDRHPDAPSLRLSVREMWFDGGGDHLDDPFGATLALSATGTTDAEWRRLFGWRAQYLRGGRLGHRLGKSVYRLPMLPQEVSVHGYRRPRALGVVDVEHTSGGLLHYDCGNVEAWRAKWGSRVDGSTIATGLDPRRRAQQLLHAYALRKTPEEQRRFFGDFYSLTGDTRTRMEDAGLIEERDLRHLMAAPLVLDPSPALAAVVPGPDRPQDRRVDFQFALVCDQKFVKPTFATMASVLSMMGEHGSVRFIVLGDGLEAADRARFQSLRFTDFDVEVIVHDITGDLDRDVGKGDPKRATFGRIYFADFLPPQRTIYLDGDVLATRPFPELFELDLGAACLAGVSDSASLRLLADPAGVPIHQRTRILGITRGKPLEYLNGGVLILDLDNPDFRALSLEAKALVVLQGRSLKQRDQDAMNIAFAGRKHQLPSKYNYMTQFYVSDRCLDGDLPQLKYGAADATLIHFSGRIKPWESPDAEFYNGLYQRMVREAERKVGVSCDFYFSTHPEPTRNAWTAQRWAEVLSVPGASPSPGALSRCDVVDVTEDTIYLRPSTSMLDLIRERRPVLVIESEGRRLLEVPLDDLGPAAHDLSERVALGVRRLPVDLVAALAPLGGVAHDVEFFLESAASGVVGLRRTIGTLPLLTAGPVTDAPTLASLGAAGMVERLEDGWLSGWYDPGRSCAPAEVALHLDGELVAVRAPDLRRPDLPAGRRPVGFHFNLQRLRGLGYGLEGKVSVCVAGTNVLVDGGELTVSDPLAAQAYDAQASSWYAVSAPSQPVSRVQRMRSVAGRVRRRLRSWNGAALSSPGTTRGSQLVRNKG